MGLISKEVEIVLGGKVIKWLESKSYQIIRIRGKNGRYSVPRGEKIKVNVKDLMLNSNVFVEIKCDGCGNISSMKYQTYNIRKKNDDKIYCLKCVKNNYSKFISFEEWCIDNNRQDLLDRWDYEINIKTPRNISYGTQEKFYFKCTKDIHKSILFKINQITAKGRSEIVCPNCNSFAQWGIDNICFDFLDRYWDYDKNKKSPWSISSNCNKKVWVKCQEKDYHGSYETMVSNFVNGSRCGYCASQKIHILDSLGSEYKEVSNVWSIKNNKTPFEYLPYSKKNVWWKCSNGKHEDYLRSVASSNISNFRCPKCNFSKGEKQIRELLIFYNIKYQTQKKFKNLFGIKGGYLSYDFYLLDYNLLIEYQGEFHDGTVSYQSKKQFEKQQEHDRRKREYAKLHSIDLLEIWYWDFNKIKEILNDILKLRGDLSVRNTTEIHKI